MSEICACQFAATQNTPRAVIVPATSQTQRQSGGCGQLGETTLHQPEGDPFTGRVGLPEDVDRDDRSEPVRDPRRRAAYRNPVTPTRVYCQVDQSLGRRVVGHGHSDRHMESGELVQAS